MGEEPVVILTGPRPDARAAAASDPGFIVSGPGPVLIDEFQHVPEILDAIKAELNTDTRKGRYVLTGSTRYSVLPQAAQSLTGRAHVISVLPLSQRELHGRRENFIDRLWADPARLPEMPSRPVPGMSTWIASCSAQREPRGSWGPCSRARCRDRIRVWTTPTYPVGKESRSFAVTASCSRL